MAERGFGAGNAVLPDAAGHCGYGSTGRISLLKLMAVNIPSLYELLPMKNFLRWIIVPIIQSIIRSAGTRRLQTFRLPENIWRQQ